MKTHMITIKDLAIMDDHWAGYAIIEGENQTIGRVNMLGGICDDCTCDNKIELIKVIDMETMEDVTKTFINRINKNYRG